MTIQHMSRVLAVKSLGADGTFMGYASVFDAVDSHKETVEKGAFKASLEKWRVKGGAPAMLWMHDPTMPIGIWIAMAEDSRGLVVQGKLALGTQKGREAYELLKMKALTGLSIGYRVLGSKINRALKVRTLTKVDLFEVSLVTFPSNDKARVSEVKAPCKIVKRKVTKRSKTTVGASSKTKTEVVIAPLKRAARKLKQKPLKGRSKND